MQKQKINLCFFKKILAFIRDADYAHAGETEAIDLVFSHLSKNKEQLLLDVGCGLGGTADYIQKHNWGKVIGFDIDPETLNAAKQKYLNIEFHVGNACEVSNFLNKQFDVIYLFNVLYAIPHELKLNTLIELRKLTKSTTQLAIFDYVDLGKEIKFYTYNGRDRHYIKSAVLTEQLKKAGWQLTSMINLDREYEIWYQKFVDKIVTKKSEIIALSDATTYDLVYNIYVEYLANIKNKALGGAIFYAKPL
jgi:cyclopropane fatty-acyl-phospholipid synthase-like methyltransferase